MLLSDGYRSENVYQAVTEEKEGGEKSIIHSQREIICSPLQDMKESRRRDDIHAAVFHHLV